MPVLERLISLGQTPREPFALPLPDYFLTPSSGIDANGLPYFSWDQGALQLDRAGASWSNAPGTPVTVTYGFRASGSTPPGSGVSNFAQFNPIQIAVAEEMLQLWAEVANITFVRIGSGTSGPGAFTNNATILFANFTNGPPQFSAFAYLPDPNFTGAADFEGDVWVNVSRDYDADPLTFSRGARILAHEIGHAIGLLHPSEYGGGAQSGVTYLADADFWQDTAQFTNMSYFSETETGANYAGIYPSAPQMFDIAAAQYLYGANMTTRTGNTVYGFNSNAGHAVFNISGPGAVAIFCIWDAGGIDTIDLSGYATNEHIDLREMSFSSAGVSTGIAMVGNISIARGVVIENAIAGSGDDQMIGNSADNTLTGNGGIDTISAGAGNDTIIGGTGNDIIDGGAGVDTSSYGVNASASSWARNIDGTWTVNAGAQGTETLTGIEYLDFTDRDVFLRPALQTFTGDGTSDMLFRRDDGLLVSWSVTGTTLNSTAILASVGPEWTPLGTGDLNGDGRADILWRHDNGLIFSWEMNGASITSAGGIISLGPEWTFLGAADLNGDLKDDLIWRNNNGLVVGWEMNGRSIVSSGIIAGLGPGWTLAGLDDFNGDGRDDFLWRNDSGLSVIWTMNGNSIASAASTSATAGADWSIVGVGDANGDGYADIIWERDDGLFVVWMMNGDTVVSSGILASVDPNDWTVLGMGDYNGDGRDDLLFQQNATGTVFAWILNGTTIQQAGGLASIGGEWSWI